MHTMNRLRLHSMTLCLTLTTVGLFVTPTVAPAPSPKSKPGAGTKIYCCPPDTMNGTTFKQITYYNYPGSGGNITQVSMKQSVNIDYTRKLVSTIDHDTNIRIVVRPDATFFIDAKITWCDWNHAIPYKEKQCINDTLTSLGPFYYGPLNTTAYNLVKDNYSLFTTVNHDCLPVNVLETTTTSSLSTVTSTVFSNMTAHVDQSTFIIPPYCPTPH